MRWVYRLFLIQGPAQAPIAPFRMEKVKMGERQRRSDIDTANAVARGVNIFRVRNHLLARHYMEYKQVPQLVIRRVLDEDGPRRAPNADQAVSEAIAPSTRTKGRD
jgi:hypothetical protein